jgi:response regulator RpfG family c-di-GMP phosphodiesterase
LHNYNIRIVLRTGQPGQAPEEQVIRDYDINDYKEKTDLTRRKLITVFYSSLRGYRDLMRIEQARQSLRRSIDAISEVYDSQNLRGLASAILQQVNHLLGLNGEGLHATRTRAYTANASKGRIKVLAATDAFSKLLMDEEIANLPAPVNTALNQAMKDRVCVQTREHFIGYFRTRAGSESVIYMEFPELIDERAQEMLEIFSRNVAVTYDGLLLKESTDHAQRMTISLLGGAMEKRAAGVTPHLDNVGKISALLATEIGMDERDVELLIQVSALHGL